VGPFFAALWGILRRFVVLWRLGAPPRLTLRVLRWLWRFTIREFAFQYAAIDAVVIAVLVVTGATDSTLGRVAAGIFGLLLLYELRLGWAAWRSAAAVAEELADFPRAPEETRFPRSHLVFPLLMLFARSVKHTRGVVYHSEGRRRVRLDIYRPAADAADDELRPAVIQVHGGGWIFGSRMEQGIPLLNHLAANGWVGFNIDYRLSPRATWPDHVIDVKRAIAWVRAHADELGIDPGRIALTGGSAGGHLVAHAALTANDATYQPGFEEADTSVAAAVPFYGLYDWLDAELQHPGIRDWLLEELVMKRRRAEDPDAFRNASPPYLVHRDAPPFLIFHGEVDTLVPVEDGRRFAKRLEAVSQSPARYVELPAGEHAFDIFPSLRTARVVEGIERFLRAVVTPPADEPGAGSPERSDAAAILSNS
jgi:acetyl esterase/lipase